MRKLRIGTSGLEASEIALGCMRLDALEGPAVDRLIGTALSEGIDFFDHADIYGGGRSEEVFAASMARMGLSRDRFLLQGKCGIRPDCFDSSKAYILEAVDGILQRLSTDYLDLLLLHRPDALVEPDEVAEAFDHLQAVGKVRHFGVSNHNPMQIALLEKSLNQRVQVNQLQFSAAFTGMIDAGLYVNMQDDHSVNRDGSVLDYCRLHDLTVQAWSPFQFGYFEGVFLDNPKFPHLNAAIEQLAAQHRLTNSAIALAWILRHPARIQTLVGTTNTGRLKELCQASGFTLTRQEWYAIYQAAGNVLP